MIFFVLQAENTSDEAVPVSCTLTIVIIIKQQYSIITGTFLLNTLELFICNTPGITAHVNVQSINKSIKGPSIDSPVQRQCSMAQLWWEAIYFLSGNGRINHTFFNQKTWSFPCWNGLLPTS